MPSAPSSTARAADSASSALARTPSWRSSSAQPKTVSSSDETPGAITGTSSVVISPVEPLMAMKSPSASSCPSGSFSLRPRTSMCTFAAPVMAGRPIPRATSAACEALPPVVVRMPLAAAKPATSPASVNERARMTSRPSALADDASAAVKTTSPLAPPGEAAMPIAATSNFAAGSKRSETSVSRLPASMVSSACSRDNRSSETASHANRTAACAGRLALRVWSM